MKTNKTTRPLKRNLSIALCSLLLFAGSVFASPNETDTPKESPKIDFSYTYSDYAQYFNNTLFPKIKECLKPYKRHFNKKKDSEIIVNYVYELIIKDFNNRKLPLVFPPNIKIFEMISDKYITYTLEVTMIVLDNEESIKDKYAVSTYFGKRFLIHLKDLSSMEM